MKVMVVGYGAFLGKSWSGDLQEVTRMKVILKNPEGDKVDFRARDGKRLCDSFKSGWKITHDDLKRIQGKRK